MAAMSSIAWLGRLRSKLLAGPVRCRQSVRLTPQHTLHLVEVGDRQFLVACHPAGTTLLSGDLPKGLVEAHAESSAAA